MLDIERIVEMFSLFSDMEGEALERWRSFCVCAGAEIEARLRPDADLEKEMEALCAAAGAWAYCDYLTMQSASGANEEVRIGDVSMKRAASAREDAEGIRRHFLAGISRLLKPGYQALLAVPSGGRA